MPDLVHSTTGAEPKLSWHFSIVPFDLYHAAGFGKIPVSHKYNKGVGCVYVLQV